MSAFNNKKRKQGFSLVEIVVAMSLFVFVAVAASSAMIAVINANTLARGKASAMTALSFAVESMTREIRTGREYDCSANPLDNGLTNDCSGGQRMGFVSSEGDFVQYRLFNGQLQRKINAFNFVDMIGPDVEVTSFRFDVMGSEPESLGDTEQPKVVLRIAGLAAGDQRASSTFRIQTMVTQRFPDF